MTDRPLAGKRAAVTGSTSGIGQAIADALARAGADVALNGFGDAAPALAEVGAHGTKVIFAGADLSKGPDAEQWVRDVQAGLGGLDILVNNAGISGFLPIDHEDYEALWERIVRVNATGEMRMIRAVLPHLRRSGSPRIVNIASTEALGATALDSAYCAAKAAVTGLTRGLAVELGKEGITVNCVCPGPITTGMTADVPDGDKELYAKRRTALRRYGRPEEVAHMTVALCQPGASFITGATIPVDGGLMARNA